MTARDAHWIAEQAARVAWTCSLHVDGCFEDIDAAIAASDYSTAIESAVQALLVLGRCWLFLDDRKKLDNHDELLLSLALYRPHVLERIRDLPPAVPGDERAAQRSRAIALNEYMKVRASVPFDIPKARTPNGFYPSIRVAREIENLRARLGLPSFDWNFG